MALKGRVGNDNAFSRTGNNGKNAVEHNKKELFHESKIFLSAGIIRFRSKGLISAPANVGTPLNFYLAAKLSVLNKTSTI